MKMSGTVFMTSGSLLGVGTYSVLVCDGARCLRLSRYCIITSALCMLRCAFRLCMLLLYQGCSSISNPSKPGCLHIRIVDGLLTLVRFGSAITFFAYCSLSTGCGSESLPASWFPSIVVILIR